MSLHAVLSQFLGFFNELPVFTVFPMKGNLQLFKFQLSFHNKIKSSDPFSSNPNPNPISLLKSHLLSCLEYEKQNFHPTNY